MVRCSLCGKLVVTVRRSCQGKSQNAVMFMSLAFAGYIEADYARSLVEKATPRRLRLCDEHFVQAGLLISSEMAVAGMCITHYDDPSSSGPNVFVTNGDIPPHLVDALNSMAMGIASVTALDISRFLNDTLKVYYSTELWKVTEQTYIPRVHVVPHGCEPRIDEGGAAEQEGGLGGGALDVPLGSVDFSQPKAEALMDREEEVVVAQGNTEYDDSGSDQSFEVMDQDTTTNSDPDYDPNNESSDYSDNVEDDEETDDTFMDKLFLVQGIMLMSLFRFCPQCGHRLGKTRLKAVGTAAVVRFNCRICLAKKWESQSRAVCHPNERMFKGNVVGAVAAITTGVRYVQLARWAEHMNLALFSRAHFYRMFAWTKPAIERVYAAHQAEVLEKVKEKSEEAGSLNLAADGAYDSRGYSALICKVVLCDLKTKLVLHTEVLHRSETGNKSNCMEVEGVRRLMRWVTACGFEVSSLTTDRNRAVGKALRQMRAEIGDFPHLYDGWHLAKWLGNKLSKVAKCKGCEKIDLWVEEVKAWLWTALKKGLDGSDVRAIFNTCLMHVKNVHEWPMDEYTEPYTCCSHEPLGEGSKCLGADSKAYKAFREVILSRSFQQDLVKASPHGGTSVCEAKNSMDRMYCDKETFYPPSTYPLRAKMAAMHWNTLQLAEGRGERRVLGTREVQLKFLPRKSKRDIKSSVRQTWRDSVVEEVLKGRLEALVNGEVGAPSQWFDETLGDREDEEYEL